jgi:hypothetical protein
MYKPLTYNWSAASNTFVAALQNGTANTPLTLNSANFNSSTGLLDFSGFFRSVTITSANNLSGVIFTITGKDNYGNIITEVLAGPNNSTVISANYYTIITSVTPNATATGVSIGSGVQGYSIPQPFNYVSNQPKTGTRYTFTSGGTNNVNLMLSEDIVRMPGKKITITDFSTAGVTTALTTSTSATISPFSGFYLLVNSGNSAAFKFVIFDNY